MVLWTLVVASSVHAESYQDIGPLDSLGDVKSKFQNAQIEKLSPGWAKASDALYKLTGDGMLGWIIVKFDDSRPGFNELVEKYPTSEYVERFREMSQQPEDQAMSVSWVRWVPQSRIPLERLVSKYGKPDRSGFSDSDFQPFRAWGKKGVEAYLSDDEKTVLRIDFQFTREEYRRAYLARYKWVPPWLEDEPKTKKK